MDIRERELAAREAERRAALMAADGTALGALLADDLIWTHANGGTDTKRSYLAKLGKVRFESIETVSQSVLVLGEAGSITSRLAMRLRLPDGAELALRSTASSVWSLEGSGWTMRRFHSGNVD